FQQTLDYFPPFSTVRTVCPPPHDDLDASTLIYYKWYFLVFGTFCYLKKQRGEPYLSFHCYNFDRDGFLTLFCGSWACPKSPANF
ncbi:hypothetical protein C0J52_13560, partial [Blattella germanica]